MGEDQLAIEATRCPYLLFLLHLCHALKFYNVTTEEGEEDPRNINIHELEGHCEVTRPKAKDPDISKPLKTK